MKKTIIENISDVGSTVSKAAKGLGSKIAQGAESAVDFVIEKTGISTMEGEDLGLDRIQEHMDVIASCGKKIGVVDGVDANAIKLTRKDSPDNQHHYIPTSWVVRVDSHVHLNKNSKDAIQGWKSDSSSCECEGI
jgi:hypothetical protein